MIRKSQLIAFISFLCSEVSCKKHFVPLQRRCGFLSVLFLVSWIFLPSQTSHFETSSSRKSFSGADLLLESLLSNPFILSVSFQFLTYCPGQQFLIALATTTRCCEFHALFVLPQYCHWSSNSVWYLFLHLDVLTLNC